MKIYLATWLEPNQGQTLTKIGYKNRLMSYFFLKDGSINTVKKYVKTGTVLKKKIKKGDGK